MLMFLDFEASSLSSRSWPIEIGLAWFGHDGAIMSEGRLIRPDPSWPMEDRGRGQCRRPWDPLSRPGRCPTRGGGRRMGAAADWNRSVALRCGKVRRRLARSSDVGRGPANARRAGARRSRGDRIHGRPPRGRSAISSILEDARSRPASPSWVTSVKLV